VVDIVKPDGAGFMGIGGDNYVGVWCILEFKGLLEVLEGNLRVWDIVSKARPGPESKVAGAERVVSRYGDFSRCTC
jgi:hypothetical protein